MITKPPLLTAHLFVSKRKSADGDGLKELVDALSAKEIRTKIYGPNDNLEDVYSKNPRVYVSIGTDWKEFETLCKLPFHEKKRWLHFQSPKEIQPDHLFYCWLKVTDPLPENKSIPKTKLSSEMPLVSVFTASYRSKEKIFRPYRSLLKQTYPHWEWVIVDDSGDGDETYKNFLLNLDDPRVRRYRQDSRNGYIGAIKRYAAGLCAGEILVEVDHDDELTPDCLEKIVNAFKQHPECGFAYGDCTEVYAENKHAHWYGWDCGYGYSLYYRVWIHSMNRWQNVLTLSTINGNTLRHLISLPNHPRAWTRDCYHLVGGHREELLVADDYDLLLRTFLCTKFVAIPDLLYIQYRNKGKDNSTFQRNRQIQILVNELKNYYHNRIYGKIKDLGMPELVPYNRVWLMAPNDPARKSAHVIHEDNSKVSILFPIPYSHSKKEHHQLYKTLQKGLATNFKNIEIIIVGNIPPEIETYAAKAPMGAIRWWPMERDDSLQTCIEYAKLCASCKEKIVVEP